MIAVLQPIVWLAFVQLIHPPDFVDFVDGSQRQYGLIVAESDAFIELEQSDPVSGKTKRSKYRKQEIKSHATTIDQTRLAALRPGHWNEYRNYAEELASINSDPIARRTAIRLLAICIANGDIKIKKSAALNLPDLASNEDERRSFGIVAYLYGGRKEVPDPPEETLSAQARKEILQFAQLLRREQFEKASARIAKPELKHALALAPWLQYDQLMAALNQRQISPDLRIKLLRVESKLDSANTDSSTETPSLVEPFDQTPVGKRIPISIHDVFDFDLQATKFANGKWIRP